MAKQALDRALEIDPLSSTAHLEMGFYHYAGFLNFEKGLKEYKIAQRLAPNDSEITWRIALILRRQGKFEESFNLMKKCYDLDPKNALIPDQMILMTSYLGLSDLFDGYFKIASELGMNVTTGLMYKVNEKFGRDGNLDEYKKIIDEASKVDHDTWFHSFISEYYRISGDYELALKHIDRIRDEDQNSQTSYTPKDYLRGIIYLEMGEDVKAENLFRKALDHIEVKLQDEKDDPRFLAFKGKALAFLGEENEAIDFGKQATSIVSVDKDKLQGIDYNFQLAQIYSTTGNFNLAVEELKKIQNTQPNAASLGFLKYNYEFTNIQQYKGFRDLVNLYK